MLPRNVVAELKKFCNQARYGSKTVSGKPNPGKGFSVLFTGPNEADKTKATEIIASELRKDIRRIHLSAIVSKYIGETEKNLEKIFTHANSGGAILLFDEADALFGKRSSIGEAHDRYDNQNAAYLLQRMEAYEGIVILATNLRSSQDAAFTRRFNSVIEFPNPAAENRKNLWQDTPPESHELQGLPENKNSAPGKSKTLKPG